MVLNEQLAQCALQTPSSLALVEGDRAISYEGLLADVALRQRMWVGLQGRSVCLQVNTPIVEASALIALEALGCTAVLSAASASNGSTKNDPCGAIIKDDGTVLAQEPEAVREQLSRDAAKVLIRTSGTTGTPKEVLHSWTTLARPVRVRSEYRNSRWLSLYPLNRYAGLQVFLQAFLNGGTTVFAPSRDPAAVVDTLLRQKVEYASGTPSFWRSLLLFGSVDALRAAQLKQVTLGGEAVDQELLDWLGDVFPKARIVHIYASTELGRCFSVVDGRAGFPVSYLQRATPDGVELSIRDGQLHARSENRMLGYVDSGIQAQDPGEWFPTGDLVEIRDDRVLFVGRVDDIVNVGGHKVTPVQVEQVLRGFQGVQDLRVFARKSSITGNLLCAEIVRAPDHEGEIVSEVSEYARRLLPDYQVPRIIREVDRIELSEMGKVLRK